MSRVILLDTMVLSELRKPRPDPRVVAWVRARREDEVFVSVVSVGEIERGLRKTRDADFARTLERWLDDLVRFYGDRVLPVTTDIARRWGRLSASLGHEGADLIIAATAASHRLVVATRNVRHFEPTGVTVIDPFAA